ncbi:RluA family pseudouridine synthase [Aquibacillus salsiterrae]|uniref:Pseudouridine synthase n=1 Tax=Aquibacillus salsiterrae TaxID=2950439 RepID=A0A9X3WBK5_9BACI|nr:RluA family pseudouridine synthase [Aquibacillus salsiterrae]MDC3415458.1 RluA family pseudouridine synthase [Aquibacillus salsiterrae]
MSRPHKQKYLTEKNNIKLDHAEKYRVKEPSELLTFLLNVSNKGRNAVKALLSRGQVLVDDQVISQFNHQLKPNQMVTIIKDTVARNLNFSGLQILYEDNDLIIIDKQSGLLSIASPKEKQLTAYRQLSDYVRSKNRNNRIFIVHRLDKDTSGVMVFAKSEKMKVELQSDWKKVVKERSYMALVEGELSKQAGKVESWLKENSMHKMYSTTEQHGAKKAVTHYQTIQSNGQFSLLELKLETGRKNQIRVHMSDLGHPVVGDKKYGATSNPINRLGLHAKKLVFTHPNTGKLLQFESNTPQLFFTKSKPD